MSASIFVFAAATAAQVATPHSVNAEAARAAGYAQAQAALAASDVQYAPRLQGSTPSASAAGPSIPVSSRAFDGLEIRPLADARANVRYYKGIATVDREGGSAAVQVTPLGMDHGRLTFAVSVLNLSQAPDNFGIENVTATVGDQPVPVLSRDRLDHMASNRAHWKQFGLAMVGGLASAAAANSTDTYHATTYTPYGTYETTMTAPSIGGQIAAANTSSATAYAIASVQARLDATRDALDNEILQTTTVMPQDSYAARFVIEKVKGNLPQTVHLVMTFAGDQYSFDFQVSKDR